jgi:hypothetical protein
VARRKRSVSPEEQALQAIVEQGAAIQYVEFPVIATIGYLELWLEHHALFFCEVGDSSTGQQHVLEFDKMEIKGDQAILYKAGDVVASIAPYGEFPLDVDQCKADWQTWVGKTAFYSDPGHLTSFASYLIRLRVVGYLPELLSAYINSEIGRQWVRSVVNQQVGQANVNGTKLREFGVPLMPMDEQKEIWSRINDAFTRIDHLFEEAIRATELLDRLDQATLAMAFRGELFENAS